MLKGTLTAMIVATAGLVAVASPGESAQCRPGYQPVRIQGNWVCKLSTPKLPLKAKTQGKKAGDLKGATNEMTQQQAR